MPTIRLPAEWEAQSGVMLTWPHEHSDWAYQLAETEKTYVALAREISQRERVLIVCYDAAHQQHIAQLLSADVQRENLRFAICLSNDTWARDHGPITVFDGNDLVLTDFIFNGWGGKFAAELDNLISQQLYQQGIFQVRELISEDFVLEGGSIESDGAGTLMVTSHCLLTDTRNPGMSRQDIEHFLAARFGTTRFLWLEHGHLVGDDTDSHIDTLARFCDENTIAYVACEDSSDVHYESLKAMEQELMAFRQADGQPYKLAPLPMPGAKFDTEGQRLPATYANFLIINEAVLVPTYDDPKDKEALQALERCFPDRQIVGINCSSLIQQYGSLHCVTMQLPAGVLS